MANIYDGAFRTILNDCRKLIIPVINEIFGETYTGDEEIQFFPNEHFIDQQDSADKERITDTNFKMDLCQYFRQKKLKRLCCCFKFLILLLLRRHITNSTMYSFTVIPAFYVFKNCPVGFR